MLTRLFVTRPTLATVLVALATMVGILSALTLRVQELPNVDLPTAQIVIFYPAASPVEMLDSIVKPLEDHLAGAPGLDHMQSRIQPGFATIVLYFGLHTNRTNDLVEIQRRVQETQSELPADLATPAIQAFDPAQSPVVQLSVTSKTLAPGDLSGLITNRIIPAIEQIPGVGNVDAKPIIDPAVVVRVDPAKLNRNGLGINDVIGAIAGNNISAPGGILYGPSAETGINIRGDVDGTASVAALPIAAPFSPAALAAPGTPPVPPTYRIGDVASVTNGYTPQRIYTYVDGRPIFLLTVQKATNASEVDAAQAVIAAVPQLEREFSGSTFTVLNDQSAFTGSQVRGVIRTLLEGILLVAIVMIFFLRSWRNAASVLIAIPASLLITLIVMKVGGLTLDTVSLIAMTLITGILVDDSIVVLENAQRHRDLGEPSPKAAIDGRLEIGLAAIVITLVDVVVFLPIAFLPGTVGKFLSEFAIVVVVATLSSLLISFTVTPALAANWSLLSQRRGTRFIEWFTQGFNRLRSWYADVVLPRSLAHPGAVLIIALVTFAAALLLVPAGMVGFEFVPPQETGEIFMQLNFPGGTPLSRTRAAVLAIERRVNALPDVNTEISIAGAAQSPVGGFLVDGAIGQIDVHLRSHHRQSMAYWSQELRGIGDAIAPSAHPVVIPVENVQNGNAQPIDYLVSDSARDPSAAARIVYGVLNGTPGAINVYSSAEGTAPQLNVSFDRDKARRLEVSVGAAALAIRAAFGGLRATQFETPNGLKDVQVIYPPRYQRNIDQVKGIPVRANNGSVVHVGDIASFVSTISPRVIDRVDRETVVHISANVASGATLSNVQADFQKKLAQVNLGSSVRVAPNTTGDQQNLKDTIGGMEMAIVLGLILVFLLMVALYNSYLTPFIIMFSVPLAVVGALGILALTSQTLNAFSLIGTVLLIGLVSKNGILLVDFANRLHAQGIDRISAVREAARTRFRPIMMTTVAMVFGMLPLALGLDPAVAARKSLGLVVIGGLTSSLLLTLVVIPVIYVGLVRERMTVVKTDAKRVNVAQ